jgi:hypothetical protein
MVATMISPATGRTAFDPRDAMISNEQFPTEFTDGTFALKPWRDEDIEIRSFDDDVVFGFETAADALKLFGDTFELNQIDGTDVLTVFGSGNMQAHFNFTALGELISTGIMRPSVDITTTCGTAAMRWTDVYGEQFRPGTGAPRWTSGTGSPEGVLGAPVGSMFLRTDGGTGTTLYIKETGAGSNTGWAAM